MAEGTPAQPATQQEMGRDFAAFVAGCRYEDLPADAIEGAKKSILDTLGVMLAATGAPPAVRAVARFSNTLPSLAKRNRSPRSMRPIVLLRSTSPRQATCPF